MLVSQESEIVIYNDQDRTKLANRLTPAIVSEDRCHDLSLRYIFHFP